MRQINLSKSTNMFKIPQTQKRKREFFPTLILSAVALPIVLKGEFKFALILYITIFVLLSPGGCFNPRSVFQNSHL